MSDDKKKGVKQEVYSPKGDLLRTKSIEDTSGYSAGRRRFTKEVTLPSGESKSKSIGRAEASFIINNPKVALSKSSISPIPYTRLDTPLAETPEPNQ